ncbi:MAG TPA: DUF1697 domain-containing protein [Candidatus Dormibacteraeota bacterium]|jgi:uncharacterized protein (DUF1697 family)|nr:DUF1697 domain-containing protein [Candidatus Dormibacteraeota bacterium]
MTVVISLLRAVNVGGHAVIKMTDLRTLYESIKLKDVQTYVQSGNVVFQTDEKDVAKLTKKIQGAIAKKFGVAPGVILRTTAEMRDVMARNPFAKRKGIESNKLHVSFLDMKLEPAACEQLRALPLTTEELIPSGRELFIYCSNGMGKSKIPWAKVDKICATRGTARNWNSVTRLLEMAEALESAK